METKHTPEQLGGAALELFADGLDATTDGRGYGANHETARQEIITAFTERDTLRQQRDELLAALQRLDNAYAADAGACPNMDMLTAYQTNSQAHAQARTALAACKKSPVSVPG